MLKIQIDVFLLPDQFQRLLSLKTQDGRGTGASGECDGTVTGVGRERDWEWIGSVFKMRIRAVEHYGKILTGVHDSSFSQDLDFSFVGREWDGSGTGV